MQIDIEGWEFTEGGFPDWVKSGVLKNNVNQIAIELHLPNLPKSKHDKSAPDYVFFLKILKNLQDIDFRLISQEVNMAVGRLE